MSFLKIDKNISILLASQSPRRKGLLEELGFSFKVLPSNVSEESDEKDPEKLVKLLALRKAEVVAGRHPDSLVIGSDTIVVCDGEILGKPSDEDEARRMLKLLSGKTHSVWGGGAIVCKEQGIEEVYASKTEVTFFELSDEAVKAYLNSGEHLDKAGAYGIQGYAQAFVKNINGSYCNVVGLDTARLVEVLLKLKIATWKK